MLLLLVSSAISGEVIARYGSEAPQKTWLPQLASGETRIVFAITEPDAGSNTHQLSTTAVRDGEEWVLSGTKYYISGVDGAGAILIVARTGTDSRTGHGLLSLFLVPPDAPGLTAQPLPVAAALPEQQFTLYFDGVRVGADQLVGDENDGFTQVFHGLNPERITGAASGVNQFARPEARRLAGSVHLPHVDVAVRVGSGERGTAWAERNRKDCGAQTPGHGPGDRPLRVGQRLGRLCGRQMPQVGLAGVVAGGQPRTVRAEGHALDR
jgi:alkylation response protein AidB-like acyl-CoA dehydrogenase